MKIKKNKSYLAALTILFACITGCTFNSHGEGNKDALSSPALPNNKVVAHRGGSMEIGCPDNSIEALNYAIELGCYASECDVYLTKDERVIVAHADREGKINGFYPWEATYNEIIEANLLANGEHIPSLEEYLDRVVEAGTILLWLDVKSISILPKEEADELSSRCAEWASEIIKEKKADNFVEFIVAKENILQRTLAASNGSWKCGLMNPRLSPDHYKDNGYDWANFSTSAIFYRNGEIKGEFTMQDYIDNEIRLSVYNVDSEDDRQWYVAREDKLYAITTNYPKALLKSLNEK